MNLSTGEFVVLCVISFIAGVALIAWLGSVNENANARRELENERLRKERDEAFNAAVTQFVISCLYYALHLETRAARKKERENFEKQKREQAFYLSHLQTYENPEEL